MLLLPVGAAARPCGPSGALHTSGARLPETGVAFARWYLCGIETAIAFAGAGRASTETVIAFAGEKWVFSVCFSVAEVSPVSTVAVEGRAVVMAVSRCPASVVAVVLSVSMSPRGYVLWAK